MTVKEWYTTYNFPSLKETKDNLALHIQFVEQLKLETGIKDIRSCFCARSSNYRQSEKYLKKTGQI